MCNLKRTNSESQRVEWWSPIEAVGEVARYLLKGYKLTVIKLASLGISCTP